MREKDKVPRFGVEDDDVGNPTRLRAPVGVRLPPTRKPWFFVVSGTSVGKLFPVRDRMVIGRGTEAEISLDDDGVSRQHARIQIHNTGVISVADLGSSNGIHINGTSVKTHSFREGDRLRLGEAVLMYLLLDAKEDALRRNLMDSASTMTTTDATDAPPPK